MAIISRGSTNEGTPIRKPPLTAARFFCTQIIINPLESRDKTGTRAWLMEALLGELLIILFFSDISRNSILFSLALILLTLLWVFFHIRFFLQGGTFCAFHNDYWVLRHFA